MKQIKLFLGIALVSVFIFFTNCKKNSNDISTSTENEFADPLFQIDDLAEMENPDVAEADEINEFRMRDSGKHNVLRPCERPFHKDKKDCRDEKCVKDDKNPRSLPFALKQLNLDSAQKRSVRGFLKDYCDCLSDHHKKAHEINRDILKRANHTRFGWIKEYKEGKITKAELMDKLRGLHKNVKDDLGKDNHKKEHIAIMKKCREGLFRNISSVLNNRQKEKFHKWMENHK